MENERLKMMEEKSEYKKNVEQCGTIYRLGQEKGDASISLRVPRLC
jgi:hypothetical protein